MQGREIFFFFGHTRGASGILVPGAGIQAGRPDSGRWSANHWTAREVPGETSEANCMSSVLGDFTLGHSGVGDQEGIGYGNLERRTKVQTKDTDLGAVSTFGSWSPGKDIN